jgi:UDP-2,3-diacylglucosamine pyrophosphatase LpxH
VKELLRRPDLDLLVLGHTHFPVLHEAAPDRFYLNAGDWVLHKTYATLTERGKPELWDWGEGAPGRPLSSAMDR